MQPLEPRTKPMAIVDRLIQFITENALGVGAQLPTEPELMEALSVGRSSVREAVRRLEALGILVVRHGKGTFLARRVTPGEVLVPLAIEQQIDSLLHALEVRRALESHAAFVAARVASDAQIAEIERCLIALETAHHTAGAALEEDLQFHLSIYAATNNPLFEQIIGPVRGPFRVFFSKPLASNTIGDSSIPAHRELFEAIARRDADRSRLKTIELLNFIEQEIREIAARRVA